MAKKDTKEAAATPEAPKAKAAAAPEAPSEIMDGPPDEDGNPTALKVNAAFRDHDNKRYPCILVSQYLTDTAAPDETRDSGYRKMRDPLYCGYVNFFTRNGRRIRNNWVHVKGIKPAEYANASPRSKDQFFEALDGAELPSLSENDQLILDAFKRGEKEIEAQQAIKV